MIYKTTIKQEIVKISEMNPGDFFYFEKASDAQTLEKIQDYNVCVLLETSGNEFTYLEMFGDFIVQKRKGPFKGATIDVDILKNKEVRKTLLESVDKGEMVVIEDTSYIVAQNIKCPTNHVSLVNFEGRENYRISTFSKDLVVLATDLVVELNVSYRQS